jgi:hypothetical protein
MTVSCRLSTEFTGPQIPHNFPFGASVFCCVYPKTTLEGKIAPTWARSTKENLVGTHGLSSGYSLVVHIMICSVLQDFERAVAGNES